MELIGGQLIVAEPKGSEHATAVGMADDALRVALPSGWIVRGQNPISLDDESAPEPDLAVVRGSRADYRHAHPARPALIIEVAESSLAFDRIEKGSLYARASIVDIIRMFAEPAAPHHRPHLHAYYQDDVGIFAIDTVELIGGDLPQRQRRLVEAWAEIHQTELLAAWDRLQAGRPPGKIEPLR